MCFESLRKTANREYIIIDKIEMKARSSHKEKQARPNITPNYCLCKQQI